MTGALNPDSMFYKALFRSLLVASLALAVVSCKDPQPAGPPPIVIPGEGEPVVYSRHIQPIFDRSCGGSGCHIGESNVSGLRLDNWDRAMAGAREHGAQIVPFNAAKSHLFQHINTDTTIAPVALPRMPLSRDPLPMEQILLIKRWIDEGARNDAGEVALAGEDRPRLYVTGQSEDLVTAIDLATQRVMRYINVGAITGGTPESPHNIIISPDKRYLYVNMIAAGLVEKYDARTFARLGSVRVGHAPAQIAITSDGSTLYVSNFDNTLQQLFINRVDAAAMRVTDTAYDVGNAPHGVTLSANERFLYTTNALGDDISEIDVTTMEVTRRLPISPGNPLAPGAKARYEPYQGELSQDGRFFWITCRASAEVRVVDLLEWRVVDSIAVGKAPLIPKMLHRKGEFWVPNRNSNNVSIISTTSGEVVATIADMNTQPHAVIFSSDGKTAFISCENQTGDVHHAQQGSSLVPGIIYVVDADNHAVLRKIEVAAFAAGMAIDD